MCPAMLAEGARVVLIDRAEDKLQALCEELGPNAHPLVVNLLDGAQVSAMLPRIMALTDSWTFFMPTPALTSAGRSRMATQTPGTGC